MHGIVSDCNRDAALGLRRPNAIHAAATVAAARDTSCGPFRPCAASCRLWPGWACCPAAFGCGDAPAAPRSQCAATREPRPHPRPTTHTFSCSLRVSGAFAAAGRRRRRGAQAAQHPCWGACGEACSALARGSFKHPRACNACTDSCHCATRTASESTAIAREPTRNRAHAPNYNSGLRAWLLFRTPSHGAALQSWLSWSWHFCVGMRASWRQVRCDGMGFDPRCQGRPCCTESAPPP